MKSASILDFCTVTGQRHNTKYILNDTCNECHRYLCHTTPLILPSESVFVPGEIIDLTTSPPPSLFIASPETSLNPPEERVFVTTTALTQSRRTPYPSLESINKAHTLAAAAEAIRRQGFVPKKRPQIISNLAVVRRSNPSSTSSSSSSTLFPSQLKSPSLQGLLVICLDPYLVEFEVNDLGIEIFMDIKPLSKFFLL